MLDVDENREPGIFDDIDNPDERRKLVKDLFFKYCKSGDLTALKKIIDLEELIIGDKDENNWTGLTWAIVNGYREIVKLILQNSVKLSEHTINILHANPGEKKNPDEPNDSMFDNPLEDVFQKPINPMHFGKYEPLHWAAYKGNLIISSLLLKHGENPLAIDMYGNTALHQAAASNNYQLFLLFMGLGIDLEIKNSRYHTALDLASDKQIRDIINRTLSIKNCNICSKLFDFFAHQFVCNICNNVICSNCCSSDYIFQTISCEEKDLRECRCKTCSTTIKSHENSLKDAIKTNILHDIVQQNDLIKLQKINIDCKLGVEAETEIVRLQTEKKINIYLDNLKVVDNHKTIIKSVSVLDDLISNSIKEKIMVDALVLERVDSQKKRLLAEKELRQLTANLSVEQSTPENLSTITEKMKNATDTGVEEKYLLTGQEISKKIELNLNAKEALNQLVEYPQREFPPEEQIDPKTKKPIAKKPEPVKKGAKKKKEKEVVIPEWAKEIKALTDKINEVKGFMAIIGDIGLTQEYITASKVELDRMGKELKFRKAEDELRKKDEEEKKKKAAKSGKK